MKIKCYMHVEIFEGYSRIESFCYCAPEHREITESACLGLFVDSGCVIATDNWVTGMGTC